MMDAGKRGPWIAIVVLLVVALPAAASPPELPPSGWKRQELRKWLVVPTDIFVDLPPAAGALKVVRQVVPSKPGTDVVKDALDASGRPTVLRDLVRLGNVDIHIEQGGRPVAIRPDVSPRVFVPRRSKAQGAALYFWDPANRRWFHAALAAAAGGHAGIRIKDYERKEKYYTFQVEMWPADDSDCADGG